MDEYNVTVLGDGKERIDGQLVYRIDCPMHHMSEDDESPVMGLDLWCSGETEDAFSLGFRVGSPTVRAISRFIHRAKYSRSHSSLQMLTLRVHSRNRGSGASAPS